MVNITVSVPATAAKTIVISTNSVCIETEKVIVGLPLIGSL